MICEKYNNLSIPERVSAIGKVIHAFQQNDDCFIAIMDLIKDAEEKGVFQGVTINPERED